MQVTHSSMQTKHWREITPIGTMQPSFTYKKKDFVDWYWIELNRSIQSIRITRFNLPGC